MIDERKQHQNMNEVYPNDFEETEDHNDEAGGING
jgi:hypothetical protein